MSAKPALEGLKVADFSWFGAGPICANHLATYGATVVRIESETHIDALRTVAPFARGKTGYNVSGYFNNFNAGKLGITVNLNTEEGRALAMKIVAWADVFLTNITPRVIRRWGLTYEKLVEVNPRIIAAYQPMQGFEGPHKDYLGFGAVLTPITGYNYLSGFPERPPFGLGTNYPDYVINPGHTMIAILAALHHRKRTGKGQHIECAQITSSTPPLAPAIFDYAVNGRVQMRSGNNIPYASPHNAFKCKPLTEGGMAADQRWCVIACFSEDEWAALVGAVGNPDWAADAKFSTLEARKANEAELEANLNAWTAGQDAYGVMHKLQATGVPAAVVQSARELLDYDEHIKERGYYLYLDHAETGRAAYDGPPFAMSKTPGKLRWPAPLLGEHTEKVCKEILELSDDEITELIIAGALQ